MAALGIPLALLLGATADLVASLIRPGRRLYPLWAARDELRRAIRMHEPASLLEVAGTGAALVGSGLVAGAALGVSPGGVVLLLLSLALAVGGAHLAAFEVPTRPAAARARARLVESALAYAGAAAGLVAVFARWRAGDLSAIRGAGEVLGPPIAVGPPGAVVGTALALLALAAAAGLLAPRETEPPRGRFRRPAAASVLVRLARWAPAGSVAALLAAVGTGLDLRGEDLLPSLAWVGAAVAGSVLVGAAWGYLDRLDEARRLRLAVPALVALAAGAGLLVWVVR